MSVKILFLHLCSVRVIQADISLENMLKRHEIFEDRTKLWHHYVVMFLQTKTKNYFCSQNFMQCSVNCTNTDNMSDHSCVRTHSVSARLVHCLMHLVRFVMTFQARGLRKLQSNKKASLLGNTEYSETRASPLSAIIVSTTHCRQGMNRTYLFSWRFILDPTLSLNLTFYKLYFAASLGSFREGFLTMVDEKQTKYLTAHGFLSVFIFYYNHHHLHMTVSTPECLHYDLQMKFSIMDADILTTAGLSSPPEMYQMTRVHDYSHEIKIHSKQKLLISFFLKVEEVFKISFKINTYLKHKIYDGPDLKSPVVTWHWVTWHRVVF